MYFGAGPLNTPHTKEVWFMDIVSIVNHWFEWSTNNWVNMTGLPRETFVPAFVGSTVLAVLSF
ncbi:hypothetical protein CGBL_0110350 [Corynebacterium glutamicum]|nr:hypothetical protein CGBL_0110350 [Corynebacterium glutamicum]